MVMKNFLLGLSKFVLGIILAMLIMSIAGLAMAKFFMSRIAELPERPTYENDLPEDQQPRSEPAGQSVPESEGPPAVVQAAEAEKPAEDERADNETLADGEYRAVVNQPVGLVLRDGPGADYAQVGGLEYQQSMVVLSEDAGWLEVRLSNGRTGWIKDGNVSRE